MSAPVVAGSYAAPSDGGLVLPLQPDRAPSPLQELVHDAFRALVLSPHFSCVGAKSAVRRGTYRMGLYGEMGTPEATAALAHDLAAFLAEFPSVPPMFTTFAASFAAPLAPTEEAFEALLWRQLQALHDADTSPWPRGISQDPADPTFSFGFAEHAFFVVGLHPASSRWTRRFAWPTLIFNRHDQFESLRRDGRYGSMKQAIRMREERLQGSVNPMLRDFGAESEARQYSGRAVDGDWTCPFHPRPAEGAP